MLTRSHVELIDMPQRMGASRKNAADIKMAVDAMELAFERDYISTFVLLHRRQRLHTAGPQASRAQQTRHRRRRREDNLGAAAAGVRRVPLLRPPGGCRDPADAYPARPPGPARGHGAAAGGAGTRNPAGRGRIRTRRRHARRPRRPDRGRSSAQFQRRGHRLDAQAHPAPEGSDLQRGRLRVPRLRRTPAPPRRAATWSSWSTGPAKGDPEVSLPEHGDREAAFSLLRSVVVDLAGSDGSVALSGLKNQLRRVRPDFSEKKLGYRSFLQFCKAAATSRSRRPTVELRRRRLPAHRQDPNLSAARPDTTTESDQSRAGIGLSPLGGDPPRHVRVVARVNVRHLTNAHSLAAPRTDRHRDRRHRRRRGGGNLTGVMDRQLRAVTLSLFVGQRLTGVLCKERSGEFERLNELIEADKVTSSIDRA